MGDGFDYSLGQKIGRLEEAVAGLAKQLQDHMDREEKERQAFMERLKPIEEAMVVRKGVMGLIKMGAAIVAFAMMFKWQDVKNVLNVMFR